MGVTSMRVQSEELSRLRERMASLAARRTEIERSIDVLTAAGQYEQILELCREYELEAATLHKESSGTAPLYAVQLAANLIVNDLNNARFLWKRLPKDAKGDAELKSLWNIGKALWAHNIAEEYVALGAFQWTPQIQPLVSALAERFRSNVLSLLSRSYSSISKKDCAAYLGHPVTETEALVVGQEGWAVEGDMFIPKRPPATQLEATGIEQLQTLAKYAVFLEQK